METFLFSFLKLAFKLYVLQSKERKSTEFAFVQDIKFGQSSSSKKILQRKELKITELVFFQDIKKLDQETLKNYNKVIFCTLTVCPFRTTSSTDLTLPSLLS